MSKHAMVNESGAVALDSTQTVRALTLKEIQDANQPTWFVVQLAISGQPINLETMPRLDVFVSYRLYTIVGRQDTATIHALRLGFFKEEVSANVVCGYLRTLFAASRVVRVSAAEQLRFAGPSQPERQAQQRSPGEADALQCGSMRGSTAPHSVASSTGIASADMRHKQARGSISAGDAGRVPPAGQPATSRATVENAIPGLKQAAPPRKSIAPRSSYQAVKKKKKSLSEELMEEARQIQLSKSGKHRVPERNRSWLSRLLGGSKR